MRPQQAVAAPLGTASVSRLYLVGTTDARSDSNRGWMRVGSLTLSVLMKGHVGDGAPSGELKAPGTGYLSRANIVLRIHYV